MSVDSISEIGKSGKGVFNSIAEAPWYAPVILTLITGIVVIFRAYFNYLNKQQELQTADRKNIMNYKLRLKALDKDRVRSTDRIKGVNDAK